MNKRWTEMAKRICGFDWHWFNRIIACRGRLDLAQKEERS